MGNEGNRHPLARYIQAGVPVALATDDEGVSRSDMTQEYLRGALDQQLDY
jgi:adenosine deaminase